MTYEVTYTMSSTSTKVEDAMWEGTSLVLNAKRALSYCMQSLKSIAVAPKAK
jgi:hypothetical protein